MFPLWTCVWGQYTTPKRDSYPPKQSEDCYQSMPLPSSHHGWVILTVTAVWNTGEIGDKNDRTFVEVFQNSSFLFLWSINLSFYLPYHSFYAKCIICFWKDWIDLSIKVFLLPHKVAPTHDWLITTRKIINF